MNSCVTTESLLKIEAIARSAGNVIMEIYRQDFDVQKKDDQSPLTKAHLAAHNLIECSLKETFPDIPVLSEESSNIPYEVRKDWQEFWLVDPLDGTKEFIKKNGEFTVNIALIQQGKPVLGVVYAPALEVLYSGAKGIGATKQTHEGKSDIATNNLKGDNWILVGSRSHRGKEMDKYLSAFDNYKFISKGSSLKLCMVAEGSADLYPRLGPTSEWDTAAAHAVVEAAGGVVTDGNGVPLRYNKENILNPWFYVYPKNLNVPTII